MRTQPNERMMQLSRVAEALAYDVTHALEHVQRELAQVGVYPTDTLAERTSGGDVTDTWPPDSTINAIELKSRREDIRDAIDACEQTTASLRFLVDDTRKIRTGAPELFEPEHHGAQRCSGKINPACEQWAAEQRLADGSTVAHLCTTCFASACLVCGNEPAGRRVDGVRAGDACYKRHLRSRPSVAGDAA